MISTALHLSLWALLQVGESGLVRERDAWDIVVGASIVVMGLAALLLLLCLAVILWELRRAIRGVERIRARVGADPGVERLRKVAENLDYITHSLRSDVKRVSESVNRVSDRLDQASNRMEERIEDFNALMEVVQGEAEVAFIETASTVRGVKAGARRFRGRDGADREESQRSGARLQDPEPREETPEGHG